MMPQFAICLSNQGYELSLEARKLYQVIPDQEATSLNLIRIIDEPGEDYLYPAERFASILLPETVLEKLVAAPSSR
jgi:hypothetical protein